MQHWVGIIRGKAIHVRRMAVKGSASVKCGKSRPNMLDDGESESPRRRWPVREFATLD